MREGQAGDRCPGNRPGLYLAHFGLLGEIQKIDFPTVEMIAILLVDCAEP